MKTTLFVLMNNEPEALMRITGLLRRKGLSVKSLRMDEVENSSMTCLTITLLLENQRVSDILFNIKKMIDVHKVEEMNNTELFNLYNPLEKGRVEELKVAYSH